MGVYVKEKGVIRASSGIGKADDVGRRGGGRRRLNAGTSRLTPYMTTHPSLPSPSAGLSLESFLRSFIIFSAFRSRLESPPAPSPPPPTAELLDRNRWAARLSPASAASRYQLSAS